MRKYRPSSQSGALPLPSSGSWHANGPDVIPAEANG